MPRTCPTLWNFFTKIEEPNKEPYAKCKKCGVLIKMAQSSTSGARYHLKTKHPLQFADLTREMAEVKRTRAEELKEVQDAEQDLDNANGKNLTKISYFYR